MKHWILGVVVIGLLSSGALKAKEPSITGTWTLTVERIGVRLVLEQRGTVVTGTLDWPHGEPITLTGTFTEGRLVFHGNAGGENFAIHISSTGAYKSNGTLTGTLHAHFDEFNDARAVFD